MFLSIPRLKKKIGASFFVCLVFKNNSSSLHGYVMFLLHTRVNETHACKTWLIYMHCPKTSKTFIFLNEWQAIYIHVHLSYTLGRHIECNYLNNGMIVSIPPHKLNVEYIRTTLLHLLRQSVVKNQKNLQDNFCISLAHR